MSVQELIEALTLFDKGMTIHQVMKLIPITHTSTYECPKCMGGVKVKDSRPRDVDGVIRRKKECLECGHIFYTLEINEEDLKEVDL